MHIHTVAPLHTVAAVLLLAVSISAAQDSPPPGARPGDVAGVNRGIKILLNRCAECHGADAKGVARHDLTLLWAAGATDAQVFAVIRSGVPNTIMPSSSAPDDEIRAIVAYLRSLNTVAAEGAASGSAAAGEKTFQAMCANCHALGGRG